MGSFTASLKTLGDSRGLPATIHLEDGRLKIDLGEHSLGDWSLDEVQLEPIPTGYRMAAEGDQILLEMTDTTAFETELTKNGKKRRLPWARKPKEKTDRARARASTRTVERKPERAAEPKPAKARSGSTSQAVLRQVDRVVAHAEKRWGALLPTWVFTRVMAGVVLGALILALVLPGLVATFLLISGLLVVMFGAVVYTDGMLASRWLPGRMAPMHVLIFGVTFLMLGVLLGVVAN